MQRIVLTNEQKKRWCIANDEPMPKETRRMKSKSNKKKKKKKDSNAAFRGFNFQTSGSILSCGR